MLLALEILLGILLSIDENYPGVLLLELSIFVATGLLGVRSIFLLEIVSRIIIIILVWGNSPKEAQPRNLNPKTRIIIIIVSRLWS